MCIRDRAGLQRLDLIKMDIEGAEIQAVRGAVGTLTRLRPHLAIASYHLVDGRPTHLSLGAEMAAVGYSSHTVHGADTITHAKPAPPMQEQSHASSCSEVNR